MELSRRRLGLVGLENLVPRVDGSGGDPCSVGEAGDVAEAAEAGLGVSPGDLGFRGGRASRPPRTGAASAASLAKPSPAARIVGLMAGR